MAILENSPIAPDGRPYWLKVRFASLYSWGRPPIPEPAADVLAAVTDMYEIRSAVVLGSCCPSILTAIAFGDPNRIVRMLDEFPRWGGGYGGFLEHSDDSNRYPKFDRWLPSKRIHSLGEWSWAPHLGEMVFADLPGSSELIPANFARIIGGIRPRLVVMGFMEGLKGPDDLEALLVDQGWGRKEQIFQRVNVETREMVSYRMVVAERPSVGSKGQIESPFELRHLDVMGDEFAKAFSEGSVDNIGEWLSFSNAIQLASTSSGIYEIRMGSSLLKVGIARNLQRRLRQHARSAQNGLVSDLEPPWTSPSQVRSRQSILAKHLYFDRSIAGSNFDLTTENGRAQFLEQQCEVRFKLIDLNDARGEEKLREASGKYRYCGRVVDR